MDLFSLSSEKMQSESAPLAWRMRPGNLDEIYGQDHLLAPGSPLRNSIERDKLHSFVLYGPPGTGKTTIARTIATVTKSRFEYMQAVTAGVNDIRKMAADAGERRKYYQQNTILFVDEIHRFNKSQQDVLLPFVEDGTLTLIGATTENPLHELNSALLSRMKVYMVHPLDRDALTQIVKRVLEDRERGLGQLEITFADDSFDLLIQAAQGDARMILNILDTLSSSYSDAQGRLLITPALLEKICGKLIVKYDRSGDWHYDCISAFIKSIRGSDADAALYWMAIMLEGGEDPKFIARRLIVHAAEDIGLADPFALIMANAAADAVQYVGLPEARIPMAEAVIYLCSAPKSNSSKTAIDAAIDAVRQQEKITVPAHIADTSHSKASSLLGKGIGYKYPHDFGGYVEQSYLPPELGKATFYKPGSNGYEQKIRDFIKKLPGK
ncbi:MAG: replication-associated recombination protein A [Syntrophomonadaceae bacterium]|nr:replication-associated recombination protein A [Syntrophomonadaceae bacterium]